MKAFGDVAAKGPDDEAKPRTYSWLSMGGTKKAWAILKETWEFARMWQEPKQTAQ